MENDNVKSPSHYVEGRKYEPRKVIADWGLNYNLGCAVKYISRAGRKGDAIEDLKKAIQYLEFEIEELELKVGVISGNMSGAVISPGEIKMPSLSAQTLEYIINKVNKELKGEKHET